MRVIATTRTAAKGRRLTELGAAGIVLEGDGFAERARGALPEGGADGAVDLIGGPAIDTVYALEQTIDAHRRMAADEATGKLVVLPHAASA